MTESNSTVTVFARRSRHGWHTDTQSLMSLAQFLHAVQERHTYSRHSSARDNGNAYSIADLSTTSHERISRERFSRYD